MRNYIRTGLVWVMMLAPATAWATHPLRVVDTGTEGKGNYLFELTGDYRKDAELKTTKLTSIFTVGAGENTDFSVEAPYLKLDPSPVTDAFASGKGDVRIKLKHRLFENEVKQSMAYQLYVDLPTGDADKGLGTNNVLWGIMLIDSQVCRSNAFHLNVGYEALGGDLKQWHFARDYAVRFGLAAERKLSESFRVLAEFAGESRKETDTGADSSSYSRPFTFLVGVIYDISKSWYMDIGARAGLNKYADDYGARVGTGWKF